MKKKQGVSQEVRRVSDVEYSTVTDSIYCMMPGRLLARRGYVYWQDARGVDGIVHVVDAVSGKETGSFGTIDKCMNIIGEYSNNTNVVISLLEEYCCLKAIV